MQLLQLINVKTRERKCVAILHKIYTQSPHKSPSCTYFRQPWYTTAFNDVALMKYQLLALRKCRGECSRCFELPLATVNARGFWEINKIAK